MSDSTAAIHDIGYQRYAGPRLGRAYALRSLYVHGVRTVFGLGRGAASKIFPFFAIAVLLLISTVVVAVRTQTGRLLFPYYSFPVRGSLLLMIFLASAAPELVSRDLRAKVLPLYFSRPIRRFDYPTAKFAALVTGAFAILAVPMLEMFLGGAFAGHGASGAWHELIDFAKGLVAAAIWALVLSAVALAIASLIGRRMLAAAAIVGVFLITAGVGAAVTNIVPGDGARWGNVISPQLISGETVDWLFAGGIGSFGFVYLVAALGWMLLGGAILALRYRKVGG